MPILGWGLLGLGILLYLWAFAQGPGPTMGDSTLQASLFTLATVALIAGFLVLVI